MARSGAGELRPGSAPPSGEAPSGWSSSSARRRAPLRRWPSGEGAVLIPAW